MCSVAQTLIKHQYNTMHEIERQRQTLQIERQTLQIDKALRKDSVSSRYELVFFDKKHAVKLPEDARALVKHKDGFIEMAYWLGEKWGWCDEGSFCHAGGFGGDITQHVVEFALPDRLQ